MHDHKEYNPQHPLVKEPIYLKIEIDKLNDNITNLKNVCIITKFKNGKHFY